MSTAPLYTPVMLAAAVELAEYPPMADADRRGSARAQVCGSHLDMDLMLDAKYHIASVGLQVYACAVGQASAAIFARHAQDRSAQDIEATLVALEGWLSGGGSLPDWPDMPLIAAARDYPGRHGAMLLPWKAACDALS